MSHIPGPGWVLRYSCRQTEIHLHRGKATGKDANETTHRRPYSARLLHWLGSHWPLLTRASPHLTSHQPNLPNHKTKPLLRKLAQLVGVWKFGRLRWCRSVPSALGHHHFLLCRPLRHHDQGLPRVYHGPGAVLSASSHLTAASTTILHSRCQCPCTHSTAEETEAAKRTR